MTDEEWGTVSLLLDKGWKGDFGPGEDRAYRVLLDSYEAEQIVVALRQIAARGHHAIPSVSEIVQAIERDPDLPEFVEAFSLIFERGGVLATRLPRGAEFDSEPQMLAARDRAALDRAYEIHPQLGRFCEDFGIARLRMLEVYGEHAGVIRRDLQAEWDRLVRANEHRDAAALARGRRRELARGPQRFGSAALLEAARGETTSERGDA